MEGKRLNPMKPQQTIGQDIRFDSVPAEITGPSKASGSAQRQGEGPDRRMSVLDRRSGTERRVQTRAESGYSGSDRRIAERRVDTGLERRRGPGAGFRTIVVPLKKGK